MRNVRANYIAAFTKHFAQSKDAGHNVHAEIRVEYGDPKRHDLYRNAVIDMLRKDETGAVSATRIVTSPMEASYPGVPITSRVAWHSMTFRCEPLEFPENDLVAWGERWIHDENPPLGPQDGLTGIIHFVSEPELTDDLVEFEVDFGSAPFEAFEELATLLSGRILEVLSDEECGDA